MRHGNITKSPPPDSDNLLSGYCFTCGKVTEQYVEDNSYDDHFGTITDFRALEVCVECGAERPDWVAGAMTREEALAEIGEDTEAE